MPKPVTELPETQVMPAEKLEKCTRRKFSPEYKLRILREADACARGELGALLRREKLYSNPLQQWRREFAEGGVEGLAKSAPGPTPSMTPDQKRIARLEKELAETKRKLQIAEDCLSIQKKVSRMLELSNSESDA